MGSCELFIPGGTLPLCSELLITFRFKLQSFSDPHLVGSIRGRVGPVTSKQNIHMATQADVRAFIDRQRILLSKEREVEVEKSSLLLSNCGPKLLEQKGLSLGGLGVASVNIGLGGKTYVPYFFCGF